MRNKLAFGAFFLLLFCLLALPSFAEEIKVPQFSLPEGLLAYWGELPENTEDLASWIDFSKIYHFGQDSLKNALSSFARCFMTLVSVSALCAMMGALSESTEHKGVKEAFSFTAVLSASAAMLYYLEAIFHGACVHLQTLSSFASGVIPVYAGLCTAGGMGGLSLTSGGGLALSSAFAALLSSKILLPFLSACFVLDFSASVSGLSGIAQISGTVRRFFVGAVGCVSALLTAVFSFQNQIAAKADTLGGRAVRYITAEVLPLVGGALAEASRTLSSAFSLVSGMVGSVGVMAVLFLLLPVLLELFMLRLCFLSAGGIAEILSLSRIAGLYRDGAALMGALLAVLSLVDAVLIFEFALLARI